MTSEHHQAGDRVRREMLGDAFVDNARDNADAFDQPFQDLSTEVVWGRIWGRDELDRRTRSLVTVATLTAMNHASNVGFHVRSALNNGATREEIREVLMHCAIYCGFPSALASFGAAKKVFAEIDAETAE